MRSLQKRWSCSSPQIATAPMWNVKWPMGWLYCCFHINIGVMLNLLQWLHVKALSHGHLDAHWMRIWSGSVAFTWMRIDLMRIWCESDRIHLLRWFGCAFKHDHIIIHDSLKVTPTCTVRSLAWLALLVGLAYGACLWLLSVLLLQQCWGGNRLVCWWSSRVVRYGKIKSTMVLLFTVLKFDIL